MVGASVRGQWRLGWGDLSTRSGGGGVSHPGSLVEDGPLTTEAFPLLFSLMAQTRTKPGKVV